MASEKPGIPDLYLKLCAEQAEWSQRTFGSDQERGPLGALRHLELEAREAQENPDDPSEFADCLLLIIDAARRAGIGAEELLQHAHEKLEICKQRKWPSPPPGDQPVQHID